MSTLFLIHFLFNIISTKNVILICEQNYEILQYYNHERSMTSKAIIRLTLSLWASKEKLAASLQFIDHVPDLR